MQPMRMPSVTFAGLPAWPDPGRSDGPIAVLGAEHATPYHVGEPSHSAGGPAALRAALTGYARLGEQYDFDMQRHCRHRRVAEAAPPRVSPCGPPRHPSRGAAGGGVSG